MNRKNLNWCTPLSTASRGVVIILYMYRKYNGTIYIIIDRATAGDSVLQTMMLIKYLSTDHFGTRQILFGNNINTIHHWGQRSFKTHTVILLMGLFLFEVINRSFFLTDTVLTIENIMKATLASFDLTPKFPRTYSYSSTSISPSPEAWKGLRTLNYLRSSHTDKDSTKDKKS